MGRQQWGRSSELRRLLATEAARLLAEDSATDYLQAKRKAALRYGVSERDNAFPTNAEIESALVEHQRLFLADTQPRELRHLRESAIQAMRLFRDFSPRLVGPVLAGTASTNSGIQLHLFADAPELLVMFLLDRDIPFDTAERRFRDADGNLFMMPEYRFMAGDVEIAAAVFPEKGIRRAPLSPVDGRPMQRAAIKDVETLLA
jgi:hypothetical protein